MFSSAVFFMVMSLGSTIYECKFARGASLETHEMKEEKMSWLQNLFFSSLEFLGLVEKKEQFKLSEEKPFDKTPFSLIIKEGDYVDYVQGEYYQRLFKIDETTFAEFALMGTNFYRIVPQEDSGEASLFFFGSNSLGRRPRATIFAYQCERIFTDIDFQPDE